MSVHDPMLGKKIRNSIELQSILGDGGMGRVYKGVDHNLSRVVAVKLLRPDNQDIETAKVYFEREARAASKLWHPNIIQVIDFGAEADGTLYLVMEYVPGRNFADVLEEEFPLSTDRIIRILVQLLTALEEAHRQGIVHRDLKPENIMLQDVPGNPDFVKVLDFGVAKAIGVDKAGPMTMQGLVMGTPHFMSPEQALGHDIDGRSDLYSVGAILYQTLTCDLPFDGELVMNVLARVITERPIPPRERRPGFPIHPGLERICMRALRKNVEGRFQSANEFRVALEQVSIEEPPAPVAPPEPVGEALSGDESISQSDLEPFRRRSRRAFTDSIYDIMDLTSVDVTGAKHEVAVLAIEARSINPTDDAAGVALLDQFHTVFGIEIRRLSGASASRVGSISVAFFGYPRSVDDDANYAVNAALRVIEAVSEEFTDVVVAVGIARGVIVVPDGDLVAAYGRPVDQAIQLASSAADSQILVDGSVRDGQTALQLEPSDRDGVFEPAFEGASNRPGTIPVRSRLPLIDRDSQLESLQTVIQRVIDARPVAVAITGRLGAGKSRLLGILAREAEQQRLTVLLAPAELYPAAIPAMVIRRIVSAGIELVPEDNPAEALKALNLPAESVAVLSGLLECDAPPDHGPYWVDALKVAIRSFLRAVASRTPVLVVVDRFEAIDLISYTVLRHLTESLGKVAFGLAVAGDEAHPLTRSFAETYGAIAVGPLSVDAISEMTQAEFAAVDPAILDRIIDVTGGAPDQIALMVEYLRNYRVESPEDLPPHAYDVLLYRLERLPESARKLLAIAGSLGSSFPVAALAGACPRSWDLRKNLQIVGRNGLLALTEDRRGDWLRFDPEQLAQLAVSQLLDKTHRQIQLRIARYFEREHEANKGSPENLFQHGRALGEAGEAQKAMQLLVRSAEGALDLWGPLAAMPVVDTSMAALNALPDLAPEIFHMTAMRVATIMTRCEYFDDAIALLAHVHPTSLPPSLRGRFHAMYADAHRGRQDYEEASTHIELALQHLDRHDQLTRARTHLVAALVHEALQDLGPCLKQADAAESVIANYKGELRHYDRELSWHPPLVRARIEIFRKQFDKAGTTLVTALKEARRVGDPRGLVQLNHALAFVFRSMRRRDDAKRALQEAIGATIRNGDVRTRARLLNDLAALYLASDLKDAAEGLLLDSLDISRALLLRDGMRRAEARLKQVRAQ